MSRGIECVDGKIECQEEDLAVVNVFMMFMAKVKTRFLGDDLAYQLINFPEGLECKFKLARNSVSTGGCSTKFTSSFFSGESSNNHDLADEQKKVARKEKIKRKKREAMRRKTHRQL